MKKIAYIILIAIGIAVGTAAHWFVVQITNIQGAYNAGVQAGIQQVGQGLKEQAEKGEIKITAMGLPLTCKKDEEAKK